MLPLTMTITAAGLDALVNAETGATEPIEITQIGLSEQRVDVAPTLVGVPGEFKRIVGIAGQSAAPNIIHMTGVDPSADVYQLRTIGLYLADGTLFAAYSQMDPIFTKVSVASFLIAFDCAFSGDIAGAIEFGDATFLYPPATETEKGVAELATQDEVDAGADDERIVTPAKLRVRIEAVLAPINAAIAAIGETIADLTNNVATRALKAITITGGGLVSGGGDLSQNRTLTVTEATAAEITAGTSGASVVTPRRLGPVAMLLATNGYIRFFGIQVAWGRFTATANASTAVSFALAFPSACFSVVASGTLAGGTDAKDNPPAVITSTISATGFSVWSADDTPSPSAYIAVGY